MSDPKPGAPSIHDLPPIETGGIEARNGFQAQDHVAAGFCIDMLRDESLRQVWCETQDDIMLIWFQENQERVEFVQVKGSEMSRFWSVAELCKREKSKNGDRLGTSVIERSLIYDRCHEACRFRLVTLVPMNEELEVLKYRIGYPERSERAAALSTLKTQFMERIGDFKSKNGHGCDFWVDHATSDVRYSSESIENGNVLNLIRAASAEGEFLAPDQAEEVYAKLLNLVRDAALERDDRSKKKITRKLIREWFRKAILGAQPAEGGGGTKLREKMAAAGLALDQIETAVEERRRYRQEILTPKYLKLDEMKLLEGEVRAKLQQMKASIDAGLFPDDGPRFHSTCLQALETVRSELSTSARPPAEMVQGCMYSLTDRCVHRFRRATS